MDVSNTAYNHDLDFRTEDGGQNVVEYRLYVSHSDNDASNGDQSAGEQLYRTFTPSDFATNSGTGNLGMNLNLPMSEVSTFLGVDINAVSPGDFYAFRSEVELSDGRVFAQTNTNATINSPAFGALFDWRVNATCPISDELFVGDYLLSYDEFGDQGFAVSLDEEVVTLRTIPGSTTTRTFDATFLSNFGGFGVSPTIEWICDVVTLVRTDCAVGCGSPGIFLNPDGSLPADITDDSEIIVKYIEAGGACGYDATRTMRLTKQ